MLEKNISENAEKRLRSLYKNRLKELAYRDLRRGHEDCVLLVKRNASSNLACYKVLPKLSKIR